MLLIFADGGKYLSVLLCKQMLRLWDWGPFCSCDFPIANSNCNTLSGKTFSEKPSAYIFFSITSLKQSPTDLVCLATIQFSFWFFMPFTWILHLWVSFSLRDLKRYERVSSNWAWTACGQKGQFLVQREGRAPGDWENGVFYETIKLRYWEIFYTFIYLPDIVF